MLSLCLHTWLALKCKPITLTQMPVCTPWLAVRAACCLACRSGQVTQKMLDAPDKRLFLGIGGLEAASQLLGFVGASKLPGHTPVLTPVLPQCCYIGSIFADVYAAMLFLYVMLHDCVASFAHQLCPADCIVHNLVAYCLSGQFLFFAQLFVRPSVNKSTLCSSTGPHRHSRASGSMEEQSYCELLQVSHFPYCPSPSFCSR